MRKRLFGAVLAGAALLGVACQDLSIENPNEPDTERALSQPSDVEALIASSWWPYFRRTQTHGWPFYGFTGVAGVHQTSVANSDALVTSSIPRRAYDNTDGSEQEGLARFAWFDYYTGLDSSNEGLRAIDGGMVIGDAARTHRARTFAKFTQGLLLGYLGLSYDQALIVKEDSDIEALMRDAGYRPYPEVIAAAIESLEEAIALAGEQAFTIPDDWVNNKTITNDRLAELAHSFIARFLVYEPRTAAAREHVDWDAVLYHAERGITHDFIIPHTRANHPSDPNWKHRLQNTDAFGGYRGDPYFLGKADVSGNYQDWLATPLNQRDWFHITTPDRRITGDTPTSSGKYFQYSDHNPYREERGTWRKSYYGFYRWEGEAINADVVIMTVDEMNLLRAEAFIRTGRIQEGVDLINITRVENGELPPVTADGVPEAPDCVPRTREGACEDLLGALMYERLMEATGLEAPRDFFDSRGWDRLVSGTFLHLPIPIRELTTLGLESYTFGGGGEGSAVGRPLE
jgi:hypothetical protein